MAKEVVAKRGCTCCGTGCVLMIPFAGLLTFGVWEILGVVAAAVLWPAAIIGAHAVRFATGNRQRWAP